MSPPLSRRTLLAGTAAVAGAGTTALAAAPAAVSVPIVVSAPGGSVPFAAARPDFGVSAYAFPLSAVRLLAGPFRANAARTHAYLQFLDVIASPAEAAPSSPERREPTDTHESPTSLVVSLC